MRSFCMVIIFMFCVFASEICKNVKYCHQLIGDFWETDEHTSIFQSNLLI